MTAGLNALEPAVWPCPTSASSGGGPDLCTIDGGPRQGQIGEKSQSGSGRETGWFRFHGAPELPCPSHLGIWVYTSTVIVWGTCCWEVINKTNRVVVVVGLATLLPNIGGSSTGKRLSPGGVVNSVILYGAPVWRPAIRISKYREMLTAPQSQALPRTACAYRIVCAGALQVLGDWTRKVKFQINILFSENKSPFVFFLFHHYVCLRYVKTKVRGVRDKKNQGTARGRFQSFIILLIVHQFQNK